MSYSLDEAQGDHASLAAALKVAAEKYPNAHHIEGRMWEVASLPEADDLYIVDGNLNEGGVWPCVYVFGPGDEHHRGNAVIIRQRCYAGPPSFLLRKLLEDPKLREAVLDAVRKRP